MSKSKNNMSGLINQLSRSRTASRSTSALPTNLVNPSKSSLPKSKLPISSSTGTQSQGLNSKAAPSGIHFGKPSHNSGTSSASATSELGSLLKKNVTSGFTSLLSGGGALGAIGGIGGIASAISSLFGNGKSTPPPLVEFTLPNPQAETFYVNANSGGGAQQGNAARQSGGTYASQAEASSVGNSQARNSEIAQAVRTALLNSSSLNDVIAEL